MLWLSKLTPKVPLVRRDTSRKIIIVKVPRLNFPDGSAAQYRRTNARYLNQFVSPKTGVVNTVYLFSYLGFWVNIMYTMGQNKHLRSTETTGMTGNGYNMMNDDNCAHFCHCWGHCGSIRRKNREFGWRGTCRFGGKKAPFMLVCWTVRGMIASASHYKWHWHLTKHMKGLRSNGTSSNVLNRDTLPPDWWCLDLHI